MGKYIKTGKKPGREKQLRPNDISPEWEDKPGQLRFARLKRLMALTETKQDNMLLNTVMPEQIEKPTYTTVYGLDTDKRWKVVGYRCSQCGKAFSKLSKMEEHPLICDKALKINSIEEDNMPIQAVTVKGERYYRWGTEGKLYKNQSDAEKQARAAYASGYQEPDTTNRGRPQNSPKVNK